MAPSPPELIFWKLCTVFFIIATYNFASSEEPKCSPGVDSFGYTIPRGDIILEYGNPLDIICVIYESKVQDIGPNSSQYLVFRRNNELLGPDMVTIVNSTAVRLHIAKPPVTMDNYFCNLRKEKQHSKEAFVCYNVVTVGVAPQEVKDFQCTSQNLDNLTCNWTAPKNYVKTTYNLTFNIPGNGGPYNCPQILEESGRVSCTWTLNTSPIYRQSVENYNFTLRMENVFGIRRLHYQFKHYERVRPGRPENFKVLGETWNSIYLSWQVPGTMRTFPPGLVHRVLYQCIYGKNRKKWSTRLLTDVGDGETVKFNLTGLEYAHAYYDVRVELKSSSAAEDDESLWSDYAFLTNVTAGKIPDNPPKTDIGSFEVLTFDRNNQRNVRIYWAHIPEEGHNGNNFTYVIMMEGTTTEHRTTAANMMFEGLLLDKSYWFYIWARNDEGDSKEKSVLYVPAQTNCTSQPTKLIKEEHGDGKYQLFWQAPKLESGQAIKNYTVFWCLGDRPTSCTGTLNWAIVSGTSKGYNQTVSTNEIYQFAISANTEFGSSGMTWADCTDLVSKYSVGKINEFYVHHLDATFIIVKWSFGCSDRSVTGYVIDYCPKVSPEKNKCRGEESYTANVTVNEKSCNITGLRPYTTYMMSVSAIINHTGKSQPSEKLLVTTLEAAPKTSPRNVKLVKVTNSSMTISWDEPKVTNGKLRYYYINYNNQTMKIDPATSVTLNNLDSYRTYYITAEACTLECSKKSKILNVTTKIGFPNVISKPAIRSIKNYTYIEISWDEPAPARGRIDYYEVQIKQKRDYENITLPLMNTTSRQKGISGCDLYISVRAVNIDEFNTTKYAGQWSDELDYSCLVPASFMIYFLVPGVVLFVLAMIYMFRKMYTYCKIMRDVEVKLPAGLAPVVADITLTPWNAEKHGGEESDRHSGADEESLLMKKSDSSARVQSGGDSSGCSSALESVGSSAGSGSNISTSTSDSGTEQPRSQSNDDLRKNSLRQRNISTKTSSKPYVVLPLDTNTTTQGWNTKSTPKNYCILGEISTNTDNDPDYMALGSTSEYSPCEIDKSSPYVLTGDFIKTINPGYVPYDSGLNVTESKNPAYVVAGRKDSVTDLLSMDSPPINIIKPTFVPSPDNKMYVQVADNLSCNTDLGGWQSPIVDPAVNKSGYVSIGEVVPKDHNKGYIPHRQFETKALKED